jgi:transposase
MWHVGLDAHWRQSTFCVLDENGQKIRSRTIRGGWHKVLNELKSLEEPFAVCFEASTGYGFLFEQLTQIARRVVVAHPGQLRLIFRSKRKNDRVDAEKLAKLLFFDEVPVVYVPSIQTRSWRSLIEHRRRLVRQRAGTKNTVRALLRSHGIAPPIRPWSRRGLSWLRQVELPTEMNQLQLDLLLERLESLTSMIDRVEKALREIANEHPGVQLLMTIPGVGIRTAEAVMAYIDDPRRFKRIKAVGSYFGLVPTQDASAKVNRLGHITGNGPSCVRWLTVEAAWQVVRKSPKVRTFFERIHRGERERRKIALVATAHYLLRIMLAMLRTGEVWRQEAA